MLQEENIKLISFTIHKSNLFECKCEAKTQLQCAPRLSERCKSKRMAFEIE